MGWKRNECGCFSGERGVRLTISENCVRVRRLPRWLIGGGEGRGWHGYCRAGVDLLLLLSTRPAGISTWLRGGKACVWLTEELRGRSCRVLRVVPLICSLVTHCPRCFYSSRGKKYQKKKKKRKKKKRKITWDHLAQRQTGGAILGSSYGKITKSVIIHTRTARLP